MPLANGFLRAEQFKDEYFFELAPAFCASCGMVQIIDHPNADLMFHENYAFFSGTSKYMQVHFEHFADQVKTDALANLEDPFVVELGSNDGIMMRHFSSVGIRHLGVEPSKNVADVARERGINTLNAFFDQSVAEQIVADYGLADAVLSANVMCHIPDLNSVAAGIRTLLKPEGVLIFEDPYLGDVIEKTSYDQIYDEHIYLFSAQSVANVFALHGLEIINLLAQRTHGGSMRYVLGHKGKHAINPGVGKILEKERALGLTDAATFDRFRDNCERSRRMLVDILKDLKSQGKRVAGYAATSKSTTVLNYCDIGPDLIEFISDTTPIKQGKFTPGKHIPVRPYSDFKTDYPDYAVLFAWNHEEEIMANERDFMDQGGKWVVFVPGPEIRE